MALDNWRRRIDPREYPEIFSERKTWIGIGGALFLAAGVIGVASQMPELDPEKERAARVDKPNPTESELIKRYGQATGSEIASILKVDPCHLDDLSRECLDSDTDKDGLKKREEDRNHNGVQDDGETLVNVADTDGDGINDGDEENSYGTDPNQVDTDGDGISDFDEITVFNTNPLLIDTDGDTYSDPLELEMGGLYYSGSPYSLLDGSEQIFIYAVTDPCLPNHLSFQCGFVDSDFDGLTNQEEDKNMDGLLTCAQEGESEEVNESDPYVADTDKDGLNDGDEEKEKSDVNSVDSDGDGLEDGSEVHDYKTSPIRRDTDRDGHIDSRDPKPLDPCEPDWEADACQKVTDSDGDGLMNYDEMNEHGTDRFKADTDGDGLDDGREVNEFNSDPLNMHSDEDSLSDGDEVNKHGTSPTLSDTDGDGLDDDDEILKYNTNAKRKDTDRDGWSDGHEVNRVGTNPLKKDTDGDGINDPDESKPRTGDTKAWKVDSRKETRKKSFCDSAKEDCDESYSEYRYVHFQWNSGPTDPLKRDTDGDGKSDASDRGQVCAYATGWLESKPFFTSSYKYKKKDCFDDQPGTSLDKRKAKKMKGSAGGWGF